MRFLHSIFYLAFVWLATSIAQARVHTIASSQNLITGENSFVTFVVEMTNTAPLRPDILVKDAFFQLQDIKITSQQGRRYQLFTYRFNSPNPGKFIIPETVFFPNTSNPEQLSQPVTLTVRDKKTLKKHNISSVSVNDPKGPIRKTYPYYTQLIAEKAPLYPNEVTRLEYKIYIPRAINVGQWGLPTGKKKNATAWRFETPDPRSTNGHVVIDGLNYQVGRFHTTVSGIKAGKAVLGPFKTRIVHHTSLVNRRGSLYKDTQEIYPLSDTLELEILTLPPNPPVDFKGDVGNFKMVVNIESKGELKTTESIRAEVTLLGRGKFSDITPPSLTNDEHWKLISESKLDLGKNRKNINSYAEFTYLIQPASTSPEGATSTPGFSFSYLDPVLKAYRTLTHPGVPVSIINPPSTGSATASTSSLTPSANQMLGIIVGSEFAKLPWYKNLPLSLIHIIPGALCLLLLLRYAYQKRQAIRLTKSHKIIQRKSLNELQKQDDESFIKAASNYIQRWVDTEKHPKLADITQLRDDHCYKPQEPIKLSAKRKTAIIDALKKLTILLLFITPQLSEAATAATSTAELQWNKGEYTKALAEYQTKLTDKNDSPDLLYNIGNCHQKLKQPGEAALFYHRAILLDPYHSRAKHNLNIIQKQNNSIIPNSFIKSGSLQDWLSVLSLTTYHITFTLSLWLILIAILYIKIIKPKRNTPIVALAIFSVISSILAGYGYYKHPDKEKLTGVPIAVIATSTNLTEQPIEQSPSILTAPPASECHILTTRGTYTYIQLPDQAKTKGWVHSKDLLLLSR